PVGDDAFTTGSNKRVIWLVAATMLTLGVISLLLWKTLSSSGQGHNGGVTRNVSHTSTLKIERLTESGQSGNVAISTDAKYIAYTRFFEQKSSIWLRQLATNTNIEIVPASGVIYGLAFTNSGEHLFFAKRTERLDYRGGLYRVSVLGGVAT